MLLVSVSMTLVSVSMTAINSNEVLTRAVERLIFLIALTHAINYFNCALMH